VLVAAATTVGALDSSGGTQRWSHRTLAKVVDVEVLLDMMVVFTGDRVTAYDKETGALRWTLTDEVARVDALVASREHIYAATRDSSGIVVSDIDPADGDVEPLTTIADEGVASDRSGRVVVGVDASAKKGGPTLYVMSRAALYALEPHDGSVRWSAAVSDDAGQGGQEPHLQAKPWLDAFSVTPGASFVIGRDGSVCRYAGDTGALVWNTCETFPAELTQAPALDAHGGRVIIASGDAVAAYGFTNGKLLWSQDQPPLAVASGPKLAYVAREDGQVQALDGESGQVQWQAPDTGDVTVLMADADGVYVGAADGSVVRLLEQNVAKVDVQ
jgi:outer membrane protein assembly factor BamB